MTHLAPQDILAFAQGYASEVPSDLVTMDLAPYQTCIPNDSVDISELLISNVRYDREFGCLEADVTVSYFVHWSLPAITVTQHSIVGVSPEDTADSRRAELVRTAIVLSLMKLESIQDGYQLAA